MGVSDGLCADTEEAADKATMVFLSCIMMIDEMKSESRNIIGKKCLSHQPGENLTSSGKYLTTSAQHTPFKISRSGGDAQALPALVPLITHHANLPGHATTLTASLP